MKNSLLTTVITNMVNNKSTQDSYGVSIMNVPKFDYVAFANNLETKQKNELFFLGFSEDEKHDLISKLPAKDTLSYDFTVEAAEEARNSGIDDIFRIQIIKNAELAKLSSLKWYQEINLENVYKESCKYADSKIGKTNSVIKAVIHALMRKSIMNILSFERVIEYLEVLLNSALESLPATITENYYRLGLCSDPTLIDNNPNVDLIVNKISKNHTTVERISNLDQAERQSITNYYAEKQDKKINTAKLILSYYNSKNVEILKELKIDEVLSCLKAAKGTQQPPGGRKKKPKSLNPTEIATQIALFSESTEQIDEALDKIATKIDERKSPNKNEKLEISVGENNIIIKADYLTEKIANKYSEESNFGGIVYAETSTPSEAINDIEKYDFKCFDNEYISSLKEQIKKITDVVEEGKELEASFDSYLKARAVISVYSKRLQDVPMLQVLSKYHDFSRLLSSYDTLLDKLREIFPQIWDKSPSYAKEIISKIISLDNIFILGEENTHAIPTPLNPLYLWKYIKLADEMLSSKSIGATEPIYISDEDKEFIQRKADDIPDPLSIMLLPITVTKRDNEFLPLSGRIGQLPIYSTKKQINQSENGINGLSQAVSRYLCLYPHAKMMLKIAFVDPPSVEAVVSMLKVLYNDKNLSIEGIDVSIFRSADTFNEWITIDDDALNDGMLGSVKGKINSSFKFTIKNEKLSYSKIIDKIDSSQHLTVIFDPNEIKIQTSKNNKQIHIHPLCVPKVYQYNSFDENVDICPSNEGGVFSIYSELIEKINERPIYRHTSSCINSPLSKETYNAFLDKSDWLIILDQSLKSWDISLQSAGEKLYHKEDDYRSIGIYTKRCDKFIKGYKDIVKELGCYIPDNLGIMNLIDKIRLLNDDGLLSIVSHSSNSIFDSNHGKGSLGLGISAIHYKEKHPDAILVGLDTQLAREWLSDRDDGILPDLIGIRINEDESVNIDLIEVKTYKDDDKSFKTDDSHNVITGHAVEQVTVLEALAKEIFSSTEKITTISRRELLRQQVFEAVFNTNISSSTKSSLCDSLNKLFAGELKTTIEKTISFVDFNKPSSSEVLYTGSDDYLGNSYLLVTIGSKEIQAIISNQKYDPLELSQALENVTSSFEADNTIMMASRADTRETNSVIESNSTFEQDASVVADDDNHTQAKNNSTLTEGTPSEEIKAKCIRLNKVFKDYKIDAFPVDPALVQEAARFTRFKVELKSGETIRSIEKSKADIAIQLEANGEILVEHIKGTKYISVDIPFKKDSKPLFLLDYLPKLETSNGLLDFIVGQNPNGNVEIMDLAKAPHMLVAGTTGSGKTIFLYSIIVSLLKQFSPEELELLIIDPKQTDFMFFEDIEYLYGGHVVTDAEEALDCISRINSVDKEERTKALKSCKSRDIESYNLKNPNNKMKRLVVVIDEYSDLIQASEILGTRKDFEKLLIMLAQRVRNLGIHLVIATQRPSAQIVTGPLKANIPFRASFRLPSHVDSQTILDMSGAENLLGKGDMIMITDSDNMRIQGMYISEEQLENFIDNL